MQAIELNWKCHDLGIWKWKYCVQTSEIIVWPETGSSKLVSKTENSLFILTTTTLVTWILNYMDDLLISGPYLSRSSLSKEWCLNPFTWRTWDICTIFWDLKYIDQQLELNKSTHLIYFKSTIFVKINRLLCHLIYI